MNTVKLKEKKRVLHIEDSSHNVNLLCTNNSSSTARNIMPFLSPAVTEAITKMRYFWNISFKDGNTPVFVG